MQKSDVEEGDNLMLTKLTPVATLAMSLQLLQCQQQTLKSKICCKIKVCEVKVVSFRFLAFGKV